MQGGFGFDAQWLEDFQHAIFALITGEKEGYYVYYGKMQDVMEVFAHAYAYVGAKPAFHRRKQSESFRWIPSHRLIVFSQNHDQVGNRLLGERLTVLAGQEAGKLAAGLVLLSPYGPLLFMGEEYGETAPFNFFVDYADKALGAATREGRMKEFEDFHWQGTAPDPTAQKTFEASKLRWQKRGTGQGRQILAYYRTLIQIRRRLLDAGFADRHKMRICTSPDQRVLFVSRRQNSRANTIIANFSKQEAAFEFPFGGGYVKILESSDAAWAGPGSTLPPKISKDDALRMRGYTFAFYETQTRGTMS
jgi:maltooligosyltrehalose trehalohydrolase